VVPLVGSGVVPVETEPPVELVVPEPPVAVGTVATVGSGARSSQLLLYVFQWVDSQFCSGGTPAKK
jgi:hypothetical protein